MKLTLFTDYSMRVLIYLGTNPDRLCSIAEVARSYGISQNHLMKVVNQLVRAGYIESVRGRFGGIRLGCTPDEINVGRLVRQTEEGFDLVDCGHCIIAPACGLNGVLQEALAAFLGVLDRYTLTDLIKRREDLSRLFGMPPIPDDPQTIPAENNRSDEIPSAPLPPPVDMAAGISQAAPIRRVAQQRR